MNNDIQSSIDAFRRAAQRYERAERYYDGQHDLRFATEKFENAFGTLFREFALNLCPVVCEAVRDKLRVTGFSVESKSDGFTRSAAQGRDAAGRSEAMSVLHGGAPEGVALTRA